MGSISQLNMVNEESAAELFRAQAQLLNQILNFINFGCLKCATQLGIHEIIHSHGKPMTLSQLIAALQIHDSKAPFVFRLMRVLVSCGFFHVQNLGESDGEEAYTLTSTSKLLLKNNPLSLAPFLSLILHPTVIQPWQCLSTWFQNDDPTPFETAYGKPFWECVGHNSELNNSFNAAMQSDSQLITTELIEKCEGVFEGLESLVDVGGGTGAVAKATADAFPDMECTVFDLPHVVGDLEASKNLKYVGGNMFETIPSADAVLLKVIIDHYFSFWFSFFFFSFNVCVNVFGLFSQ